MHFHGTGAARKRNEQRVARNEAAIIRRQRNDIPRHREYDFRRARTHLSGSAVQNNNNGSAYNIARMRIDHEVQLRNLEREIAYQGSFADRMMDDQNNLRTVRGSKLEMARVSAKNNCCTWFIMTIVSIVALIILKSQSGGRDIDVTDDCKLEGAEFQAVARIFQRRRQNTKKAIASAASENLLCFSVVYVMWL